MVKAGSYYITSLFQLLKLIAQRRLFRPCQLECYQRSPLFYFMCEENHQSWTASMDEADWGLPFEATIGDDKCEKFNPK